MRSRPIAPIRKEGVRDGDTLGAAGRYLRDHLVTLWNA